MILNTPVLVIALDTIEIPLPIPYVDNILLFKDNPGPKITLDINPVSSIYNNLSVTNEVSVKLANCTLLSIPIDCGVDSVTTLPTVETFI